MPVSYNNTIARLLGILPSLQQRDCPCCHCNLWAGLQYDMSSTHKGNKSWFAGLGGVQKRAQRNLLNPRFGLVLPSIVAPLNDWCYGLTSAKLCWVAIGWHGVGRRLWDTGQGLEMDCV